MPDVPATVVPTWGAARAVGGRCTSAPTTPTARRFDAVGVSEFRANARAAETDRKANEMTQPHHTAEHWAGRRRDIDDFIVTRVVDHGDTVALTGHHGWTFNKSKAALGRDIHVGEHLQQETIGISQVTGLRDANGWLFHYTDQELADQARELTEKIHRNDVVRLEKNRKQYAEWEAALPDWLKARIQRFRDAAGEKFLLEGWGYELIICRLADLIEQGHEDQADQLACDEGATGNQWSCAKALAAGRAQHGDDFAVAVPAGLSPITGSADYSG